VLLTDRVPPHLWFVGSAVFHYLGPSFAVLLFAVVPVAGVAWLRIVSAALVFAVWRRPWRSFLASGRRPKMLTLGLGVLLAAMNLSFYNAIDRLPLGTVAGIEFVGPVILAVAGSRTRRNLLALSLAVVGVYLLTDIRIEGDPVGFAWAFTNAALFTGYIILAHQVAGTGGPAGPVDRLGMAMIVAAVAITPVGLGGAGPALGEWVAIAAGIGVGVSSSVIPYVFDQLAMRRLSRETYSVFVALLPAAAVVIGVIVLGQIPRPIEVAATGLIITGVLTHEDRTRERGPSTST